MKKNNKLSKYLDLIICILFIFLFSVFFNTKHYDNDLFFDLKTGETILKYGVDFKDHFSFIPNLIYLYHHWLYDLIIYFIKNCFGFFGIRLFFLIVFFVFNFIYFYVCNKIINNKFISLLITFFVSYYASIYFTTRVQSITYILFFLEVLLLDKIYDSDKKRYLIYLLLLCVLIVNLHMPLWILCLVLFLPYLCSALISEICSNKKIKKMIGNNLVIDRPYSYKHIWLSLLIILVSAIISPYGLRAYTFFIKYLVTDGYFYFQINELHATALIYHKYDLAIILLLIVGLYLKAIKVSLKDLFLILGLFIFSLMSIRNIIYILIIGSYVLIKSFVIEKKKKKRKIYINKNVIELITIPFLIIIIVYVLALIDYPNNNYDLYKEYPVEIVEYMKKNLDIENMRLYNHFNFGSYIEYQDIPVFVDSRAEVYIKEFNGGYDIAKDCYESNSIDGYEEVFKKYKFNYALIYKDSDQEYYFKYNDNFKIIKSDDRFILYSIDEKLYKQ